ncbi:MAG: hypothetical protein ACTSYB_11675 [Candidatus Helarchaeota archaeon]
MKKVVIIVGLMGIFLSLLVIGVSPIRAYGDTGLRTGDRLIYDVSLIRTQNWTIEGRWDNLTHPGVWHYTNFQESRARIIVGVIIVDILEVRMWDVDMRITYELSSFEYFYDRFLDDDDPTNDYSGSINQTLYPSGPPINLTLTYTSFWNQSDSFELEVNKLTRDIEEMTKYNTSVALSTALFGLVSAGTDHISFWIYPDAKSGEPYSFAHIGMFLELIGDYDNWGTTGDTQFEIEGSRIYYPPAGGKGFTQRVWICNYESPPDQGTPHSHTVDLANYVNEFLFDQDTGILLQYRRSYRLLPYDIIRFSSTPNTPIQTDDLYNLEFTMTLRSDSKVWLGLSYLGEILLWIFIPVGIIAIIIIFLKRRR